MRSLLLVAIGLATSIAAAVWVNAPGYMDADYYLLTARQLAQGRGFTEPVLWNYLDDPAGLPHPSHLYWQPLTSLVAAAGLRLFGDGYRAAQIPFVLLAGALPLLTAKIGYELSRDRGLAMQAGLLAAFPGFFLPFQVTTDAFALTATLGGGTFLLLASAQRQAGRGRWLAAGAACGLASLARADSLLLLATAAVAAGLTREGRSRGWGALGIGFGLVVGPWWARNLALVGSPLSPGGIRLLWMLDYDELFSYPADILTFERWGQAGLAALATARGSALLWNAARLVAENGLVFLGPFMGLAAVRFRAHPLVRSPLLFLIGQFAVMTLVFPYIGPRGALFHSSAAAMPVMWALAPIGVRQAIDWGAARRGWELSQARRVLGGAALLLAAATTIGLLVVRQILPARAGIGWGAGTQTYRAIGDQLAAAAGRVAVNNPPGFSLNAGREAVVIPNGPPSTLRQVVRRYGVRWVVLEFNHPAELGGLYADPHSEPWLSLRGVHTDPFGRATYLLEVRDP